MLLIFSFNAFNPSEIATVDDNYNSDKSAFNRYERFFFDFATMISLSIIRDQRNVTEQNLITKQKEKRNIL